MEIAESATGEYVRHVVRNGSLWRHVENNLGIRLGVADKRELVKYLEGYDISCIAISEKWGDRFSSSSEFRGTNGERLMPGEAIRPFYMASFFLWEMGFRSKQLESFMRYHERDKGIEICACLIEYEYKTGRSAIDVGFDLTGDELWTELRKRLDQHERIRKIRKAARDQ